MRTKATHQGKDYAVKRSTAMNFWPSGEKGKGNTAMYEIPSEREM
jgi:hypothetical protein